MADADAAATSAVGAEAESALGLSDWCCCFCPSTRDGWSDSKKFESIEAGDSARSKPAANSFEFGISARRRPAKEFGSALPIGLLPFAVASEEFDAKATEPASADPELAAACDDCFAASAAAAAVTVASGPEPPPSPTAAFVSAEK